MVSAAEINSLRGAFVWSDGSWHTVTTVGPKQTSAAAVTFRPPSSMTLTSNGPAEQWEVSTKTRVYNTIDFVKQHKQQKEEASASWECAVEAHSQSVKSYLLLAAQSAMLGQASGGGPGGGVGGGVGGVGGGVLGDGDGGPGCGPSVHGGAGGVMPMSGSAGGCQPGNIGSAGSPNPIPKP